APLRFLAVRVLVCLRAGTHAVCRIHDGDSTANGTATAPDLPAPGTPTTLFPVGPVPPAVSAAAVRASAALCAPARSPTASLPTVGTAAAAMVSGPAVTNRRA